MSGSRCWWCQHPVHVTRCQRPWQQLDEHGVCECVRTPDETEEAVVAILAPAIAEALRGPGAKVRASDVRRARSSFGVGDKAEAPPTTRDLDRKANIRQAATGGPDFT